MSDYKKNQLDLNALYKSYKTAKQEYDNKAVYLFVLPEGKAPETGQLGDMPIGKQWGYLFGAVTPQTLAHELAHGKLSLTHTFANYVTEGTTTNLMDYPSASGQAGDSLIYIQWTSMHEVAILDPFFQDDGDGAYIVDLSSEIIEKVLSNGANGCAFVRYKISSAEYIVGKYESDNIVISSLNNYSEPIPANAVTELKNLISSGVNEFIVYIKPNGEIGLCTPQEDYSMFNPLLLDFASDPDFLQKFKTDYLRCKDESERFLNLTTEFLSNEQKKNLELLFGGTQTIRDPETGLLHDLKCYVVYTNEGSSEAKMEQAQNFTPPNGELKIWVHRGVERYEIRSVLPDNVKNNLVLKDQNGNIIYTYKITDYLMTIYSMNPALDQLMGGIYEFFDFCSKVLLIRISESVYNCDDEVTYSKFYKYIFKYLPKPVAVTALADFAKTTLANSVEADYPELANQLRNLDDGNAEFAFYCGVYNGLIETVASVADLGKIASGAFYTKGLADFNQLMGSLEYFVKIDENNNVICKGAWCALRMGFAENFSDRCKMAEFGGEIAFVVILAVLDPLALEGVIGGTAAKVVRVLKYLDDFPGKVSGLDYVVHFTADGVGHILNGAKKAFGTITDEKIVAKALNSSNEVFNVPNVHIKNVKWVPGEDGKLIAEIDGKSYTLISKIDADIYELIAKLTYSIDATTIAQSRIALGAIANDLTDNQIIDIIKKNYLASGMEYLEANFPLTDEHLITLRSELQKFSLQKGIPPINHDMTKIMHPDLLKGIEGGADFISVLEVHRKVSGYVGRAEDFKGGNIDQIMKDYRLDWKINNPYLAPKGKEKGYAIVRYKNSAGELEIPTNSPEGFPNTKTGMVGNDSRVIFEYKYKTETGRPYEDGDILEYFDKDGVSKNNYKFDKNRGGWVKL
jgi:hypothetical protein